MLVLGVVGFVFLRKRIKSSFVRVLCSLFIVIPFFTYFLYKPIYQGDFSNSPKVLNENKSLNEINYNRLSVITIPNCPYCFEVIPLLNKIQERNNCEIDFIVLSSDSSTLNWYKKEVNNSINVVLGDSLDDLSFLAEGRFPSFVWKSKNKKINMWSNDKFGAPAIDWVEDQLAK